jgi:hypothetical protein
LCGESGSKDAAVPAAGLDRIGAGVASFAVARGYLLPQRFFNGSSTLVRDHDRMNTRWTSGTARAWSALFTAPGPEIYSDHGDRDADSRRVRSELAAISARFDDSHADARRINREIDTIRTGSEHTLAIHHKGQHKPTRQTP